MFYVYKLWGPNVTIPLKREKQSIELDKFTVTFHKVRIINI